jgi:hypothetical protein
MLHGRPRGLLTRRETAGSEGSAGAVLLRECRDRDDGTDIAMPAARALPLDYEPGVGCARGTSVS